MKYMKLGTKPDIFYTEHATRAVNSDVPSDLAIKVDNTTFHVHKHLLLPKCGLLQRICSSSEDSSADILDLHDIPGGAVAFELCAKFCYGIAINVSAHNFVSAFCAAKYLEMTETTELGNLVAKLEAFFHPCIVQGWKDSLVALQSTASVREWPENLGIIRSCIDSIVEKIVTPTSKVKWSYTYIRPGYTKEQHQTAPRDWWIEDISNLNIDIFRGILMALRSLNMLPPQLIGEALHVYACRWLPIRKTRSTSETSASQNGAAEKNQRVVEMIVSLIPAEEGSVSVGFLIKLLNLANLYGVSQVTKAELVRRTSQQLEEATINDLLLASLSSSSQHTHDIDLIKVVLESFLEQQKCQSLPEGICLGAIRKVGKLIDAYLQVVAREANLPVSKIASLAEALPAAARPIHDELYKSINIYLKEHQNLTKEEKKQLCRALDCQKLSAEARAHMVKNEQLPLRTVVQVLFSEQQSGSGDKRTGLQYKDLTEQASKSRGGKNKNTTKEDGMRRHTEWNNPRSNHQKVKQEETLQTEPRDKEVRNEVQSTRVKEIEEIHTS